MAGTVNRMDKMTGYEVSVRFPFFPRNNLQYSNIVVRINRMISDIKYPLG